MIRRPGMLGALPATIPSGDYCAQRGLMPEVGPDGMPTGYCVGCGANAVWNGSACDCAPGYYYPGYGQDCLPKYGLDTTTTTTTTTQSTTSDSGVGALVVGAVLGLVVGAALFSKK